MDFAELWDPEPGWLNTASYGLPPRPAWEALQAALSDWRVGATSWEPWDESTTRARESFARLVGADATDVFVGSTVSAALVPIAAALPCAGRLLSAAVWCGRRRGGPCRAGGIWYREFSQAGDSVGRARRAAARHPAPQAA